jgi:hypothetical protein
LAAKHKLPALYGHVVDKTPPTLLARADEMIE